MTLKERIEEILRNSGLSILARKYITGLQIDCEEKALTADILKAVEKYLKEERRYTCPLWLWLWLWLCLWLCLWLWL